MGRRRSRQTENAIAPIIQLWMLRILVPLRGDRNLLQASGFREDAIAEAINLGHSGVGARLNLTTCAR